MADAMFNGERIYNASALRGEQDNVKFISHRGEYSIKISKTGQFAACPGKRAYLCISDYPMMQGRSKTN